MPKVVRVFYRADSPFLCVEVAGVVTFQLKEYKKFNPIPVGCLWAGPLEHPELPT